MPNIGFGELMVLVLVALIVFGPDRLPEMARSVGKFVRNFQRETSQALSDLKEGLEPVKAGVFDEPDPLGLGSFIDSDATPDTIEQDEVPAALEPAAVPPVAVKRSPRARTPAKAASRTRTPAAAKRTPARAMKKKSTKTTAARAKTSNPVRRGTTRKR